jgi:predicted DNA-binding transcriptional regulator AlpA
MSIVDQAKRLRTEPAAKYCASTKSTMDKLRITGDGPLFSKIGRIVVYDTADLDSWLASTKRRSTSEKLEVSR